MLKFDFFCSSNNKKRMPCSNCGQSGHNILTCKNEKVSKINLKYQKKKKKKKKKEEEKFQGEMNIDHIKAFTVRNTRGENDKTNKIRENIIVAIGNDEIDQAWFLHMAWSNLNDEVKKYEIINSPDHYEKAKWEKKAGRKYKYDFELTYLRNGDVIKTREIEFKNNVMSVKGCPQFVSPTNPSQYIVSEKPYEEFFYDKYLPQICKEYGREVPKKEDYLKQIHCNKSSCLSDLQQKYYQGCKKSSKYTGEEEDIEFYKFCKELSKQSIIDFFKECDLDYETLNNYLQSSQKNKEFMLFHNGKIYHETMDIDDYTIDGNKITKKPPYFKCKTISGKNINILFRWKNGNGIAFPAFQIK